ncbi:hypothetical protein [Rhodovulum sulfidophilum]|uniref:Uncharacterized protein n=1 Tax=Rhodovulum sulfidophilum TaxID=35806 RepID=A0ABS1RVG0_RHOSU|nr:hypothetical protein [Rhodovulum sulfidophilum]MBL3610083.1 hypothetical protein [Rhodovulum sulfidophilum]MCE8458562.1 hypothetical protein [Rhodovulum sulfidophilum]
MVRKIAEAASRSSAKIVSGGQNASPIAHRHARGRAFRKRAPGDRQPDRPVRQEEGQIRARITHQIEVAAVMMRAGRRR